MTTYILHGDGEELLAEKLKTLLAQFPNHEVSKIDVDVDKNSLTNLFYTDSLFSTERVLIAKNVKKTHASFIESLQIWTERPHPDTVLIAVFNGKAPKEVLDFKSVQSVEATTPRNERGRDGYLEDLLRENALDVDFRGRKLMLDAAGENMTLLSGWVRSMKHLGTSWQGDAVVPFLSEQGSVPMWDLTDAIDARNTAKALITLSRLWDTGKAPVPVMYALTAHINRLRLTQESGLTSEKEIAKFLGMKGSTYPAKKAYNTLTRWKNLDRFSIMCAEAANDVRGTSGLPPKMVVEKLVALLSARPA